MKYLLLTDGTAYFPELLKPFERAGLYNWMKAFQGEVRLWGDIKKRKHELQNYDIIHVNSYGQDIGLATAVAEHLHDSSTKLVVNMDISINYFDKDMHLREFVQDLHAADHLFGVEPAQVNLINYLCFITRRTKHGYAHLLPHPIDLPLLMSEAWVSYDKRLDMVAFQYHKYDRQWDIPRMLLLDLPKHYIGAMLGYIGGPIDPSDMAHLMMPFQSWERYVHFLARCKVGFEYRTHRAASRFVMEAGALGIPVVTTTESHMGKIVSPVICHPVEDYMGIRMSIEKLIEDEEWRLHLAREGLERLEPYNFENSKQRFMEMIE